MSAYGIAQNQLENNQGVVRCPELGQPKRKGKASSIRQGRRRIQQVCRIQGGHGAVEIDVFDNLLGTADLHL
jgi:hypothetical protein